MSETEKQDGEAKAGASAVAIPGRRRWVVLGVVVAVGVVLDQITKWLADTYLKPVHLVTLIDGFVNLNYSRNPGAFFSLGATLSGSARRVLFVVATIAAMALIVQLYRKAHDVQRALRWALALLLAGAVGNLIDRVLHGEVTDFVQLHWQDKFRWATFNVADVWITFGLVLLVWDLIKPAKVPVPSSASQPRKGASGS